MKNSRAITMLIIAMVAGLAAVAFASRWLVQTSTSAVTQIAVAATRRSGGTLPRRSGGSHARGAA